jgi:arginase
MAVVGVPSAAGARSQGVSQAPFALREAGLLEALGREGTRVVNLSDLSLFSFREDEDHPRERNAPTVACALRAIADEMGRALQEGFTLVLGGDCTLVVGVVGGMKKALQRPVGLVYLDANADLNTPETSPSGFLNGMALALALGKGPPEVVGAGGPPPAVRPEETVLVGFRSKDPGEEAGVSALAWAAPAEEVRRLGMEATAQKALETIRGNGPILVHFDVDVIDPKEMPAKDCLTPGPGISFNEAQELLSSLLLSPRVAALLVSEFHPAYDRDGTAVSRLSEALSGALRGRFRDRPAL